MDGYSNGTYVMEYEVRDSAGISQSGKSTSEITVS